VVYIGTQPGTYTQSVDVGPATSYSFTTAVAGQLYCFAVSAYASGPVEGPRSQEVCGYSNQRPTLTNPGTQSSTAGQADSLQLVGNDPDGLSVTYSATGLPPGLSIGSSTGFISGTPTTGGNYSVTATAFDGALSASQTFSWDVAAGDTTAPTISITGPTSNTTYATTSATVNLSGTASDADGVTQVTWTNDRGGSGTATGTTSWSVTAIPLQSGANVLTVTARDAANNTRTDSLTVTYTAADTTVPAVSITGPTSSATFTTGTSPLALSGTASDNVGVTQVTWTNDRGGSGTATGTTAWSVSAITLQSGANVLTVTARDAAGNTSTDTLTVTYNAPDTTAPTTSITVPTSAATYTTTTSTVNMSGTATDAVGVTQVSWANSRGGNGTATGTNAWAVTGIPLLSGSNVITITARDAAGNNGIDTLTVTYNVPDTTNPAVTITGPTSSDTHATSASPLAVSGTASDNVGVTQVTWANDRGGSGTATGTTTWSASAISLLSGANVITVTARDAAGNTATDTITVTYTPPDTTAPTASITAPTSAATYTTTTSTLNVSGTASDAIGVTQVSWSNNRGGSGTATGTTAWSVSGITLLGGSNVITITARDAAGNNGTDTLTVTYNVPDTTNPAVTITGPTSSDTHATSTSSLAVSGTASDNVGVTQVSWTNDRGGSGNATGTTSWNASAISLLSGANVITITARDAAGNTATDTITVTYTPPDTSAPSVSITDPTSSATYVNATSTMTLSGTASDSVGVTQVTWTNNRGGSGTATGTTSWSTGTITLQDGSNTLTITARDAAGNAGTDVLTVTYDAPDTTAPAVSIAQPTSAATYSTSTTSVNVSGTASDARGVTQVTWSNDRGGNGTATGTASWSASGIALLLGDNVITITARDAAGNTATDTLTVAYAPPPLTLTNLTANRTAPQTVGTAVTFTATAAAGIAPYQYKWYVFDGTTWNALQTWSSGNTFTWTPASENSAYRVAVWIRNAGSTADSYDNAASNGSMAFPISPTPPPPAPLALTSLTANQSSPQQTGTAITFSAGATGGTTPYQYKWLVSDGTSTTVAQSWSTSSTFTWTPTTANPSYQVSVWARNANNSTDAAENANSVRSLPFAITAPPPQPLALTSLVANLTSPQRAGTPITFSASVTGGTAPHQFKWWVFDGSAWTMLQAWTTNNAYTWTPTGSMPNARIAVWVRSAGNTADAYENAASNGSIAFPITGGGNQQPAPLALTNLTANQSSPQQTGTAITFSAGATGGTTPYQYKWLVSDGTSTTVAQNWSTSSTFTWTPTTANPSYQVSVWARSGNNSTDAAENANSVGTVPFAITTPQQPQPQPLALTNLVANMTAPQRTGTSITFWANVTGGTAPHQFKWWLFDGSAWVVLQTWTTNNVYTWTPTSSMPNARIAVWVRNAGNTADAYENAASNGSIAFPISNGNQQPPAPLALTNLTANQSSPQQIGAAITFSAGATGGTTPYQYKWLVSDGTSTTVAQNWSASSTFTWTPTAANPSYQISVWARSGNNSMDAAENANSVRSLPFAITTPPQAPPLALTNLVANMTAPQRAGTSITFWANVTGGTAPHQFKWWVFDGSSWSVLQTWTTNNVYTWTPTSSMPNARIAVWVRNAGSTIDAYDNAASNGSIAFPISGGGNQQPPPPAALTLTGFSANLAAPQAVGTSVTFTASASGGTAPYQYKWLLYDGSTTSVLQNWTTSNTHTWTPSLANSAYRVTVWVRNSGSMGDSYDNGATATMPFTITPPAPPAPLLLTGIVSNLQSPQPVGSSITFAANVTGGSGSYQYKWWIFNGITWNVVQDWSTDRTFRWTATTAGSNYRVAVWVRNASSTIDAYDNPGSNGSIGFVIQ
jgi:hypothetical protein